MAAVASSGLWPVPDPYAPNAPAYTRVSPRAALALGAQAAQFLYPTTVAAAGAVTTVPVAPAFTRFPVGP